MTGGGPFQARLSREKRQDRGRLTGRTKALQLDNKNVAML